VSGNLSFCTPGSDQEGIGVVPVFCSILDGPLLMGQLAAQPAPGGAAPGLGPMDRVGGAADR
jgi:hypothetical protein